MPPLNIVELTTRDFGRWAQRARLVLPVPLSAGYAARVTLDWDELLAVSEDRLEVSNAAASRPAAVTHLPVEADDLLAYAEPILREPHVGVFAGRAVVGGEDIVIVGLGRGNDGLVVSDSAATVTLRSVPAHQLASTVVAMLPSVRPLRIQPVVMNERALAVLAHGADERGLSRVARNAVTAAGLPEDVVATLARLQSGLTARGLLGAVRYVDGPPVLSQVTADWFESSSGSVLKRALAPGQVSYEPASASSLTSVAVAAMASTAAAYSPRAGIAKTG